MKKFSDYNIKKPTNCNFKNFVSKIYGNLFTHGALRTSLCLCVPDRIGIWKCWFLRRGENRRTWRKTSRSKQRTSNKLNSRMALTLGFEPRPHWWEANALPTAPSLLPKNITYKSNDKQQNGFA